MSVICFPCKLSVDALYYVHPIRHSQNQFSFAYLEAVPCCDVSLQLQQKCACYFRQHSTRQEHCLHGFQHGHEVNPSLKHPEMGDLKRFLQISQIFAFMSCCWLRGSFLKIFSQGCVISDWYSESAFSGNIVELPKVSQLLSGLTLS